MHVLLVDDEAELVSTLAERLSFRGIEAHWTASGKMALEKASQCKYQVAVLDVRMPGVSGLDLMIALKKDHPDMKFIFMTGHGSEDDFKQGRACGACSYLVKPVQIEELVNKLKEAVDEP